MRHDNIRDFEANLIRKICNDVEVEPSLQPLAGEIIRGEKGDDARADVRGRGVWRPCQNAFFDVCVTNVNCTTQKNFSTAAVFKKTENKKKNKYNDRIMNVEHGTFTPLVFSINGSAGPEAETLHKHLADKISSKTGEKYAEIITWIRCKITFIILRACLACLRGSRQRNVVAETNVTDDFSQACDDARLIPS